MTIFDWILVGLWCFLVGGNMTYRYSIAQKYGYEIAGKIQNHGWFNVMMLLIPLFVAFRLWG